MIKRFIGDKRGVTAVFFGLSLPVLVGFLALGTESAYWFYKARELQKIADIAAYNGAVELSASDNQSMAVATATKDADFHGLNNSFSALTVNAPPTSGSAQNGRSVEVIIDNTYDRLFSAIFSAAPINFTVRAVASFQPDAQACILALSPTANRGVEIGGSADTVFDDCVVMSNSISEESVYIGGNADLETPCVRAVGGITDSGGMVLTECEEAWPYSPKADDPYENLPDPINWGGCQSVPNTDPVTLSPGRYCGGFTLKNNVTLDPGVYIIDGGTWQVNANANVYGEDVTFFLTDDATTQWNGTADIDLSAPTSGTYEGVLIFGDRTNDDDDLKFNGTANSSLVGAIYTPAQPVEVLGDFGGSNGCTQIVALTILLSGNTHFTSNCTGTGIPVLASAGRTRIVE